MQMDALIVRVAEIKHNLVSAKQKARGAAQHVNQSPFYYAKALHPV